VSLVVVDTPSYARLEGVDREDKILRIATSYRDKRAEFEVRRFQKNPWNRPPAVTPEEYQSQLEELRARVKGSVLLDQDGELRVPAGLAHVLADKLRGEVLDTVQAPPSRPYPWHRAPAWAARPYQEEAVDRLIEARHGAVELAPGTGKTKANLLAVKRLGLRTVVVSPFAAIVRQTHREFLEALGPRVVGVYGDGSHDLSHPVTIATAQALVRLQPGSKGWDFFQQKQVLSFDESHLTPAETVQKLCYGVLRDVPYRFFWSGTQLRTDGLQVVLDGIVGRILLTMDVEEAVRQGFLARPRFRMVELANGRSPRTDDPAKATREALFRSEAVNRTFGELVNRMVAAGRPALVLVDELDQFARLLPHLRYEARFAHACADAKTLKAKVPQPFWKVDTLELVDEFNAGRYPILVGTSCVGTGVDVRACGAGFYLRGGRSEIDARQSAGRFMRLHPGKSDVIVFDVDVTDGGLVHGHAEAREEIWRRVYPDFMRVRL
jgi:superfamily II DNA or RNA helicase